MLTFFFLYCLQPTFLTKEQRAQLALDKRKQEADEQRKKQDEEAAKRQQFLQQVNNDRYSSSSSSRDDRNRYGGSSSSSSGRPYDRSSSSSSDSRWRARSVSPDYGKTKSLETVVSKEILEKGEKDVVKALLDEKTQEELIKSTRARYLGTEEKKRKIRKLNDRKFVFDWEAGEDTSHDANPLYNQRHDYQMFGRYSSLLCLDKNNHKPFFFFPGQTEGTLLASILRSSSRKSRSSTRNC